ncbi:unnamed protein product [Penicillium salamii]|nr:unnamed protein product [Penicillium salamii]CAG8355522.1 unnamed protein product [Penicillium salamii]
MSAMAPKQKSDSFRDQTQDQQPSGRCHVWLLGSSVASLASAVYLIRDAKVPASYIHLIESRRNSEDALTITGDPVSGYDYRAACMPTLSDACIDDILTSVPSARYSGKTGMNNIGKATKEPVPMSLFIQCGRALEKIDASTFSIGLKVRAQLALFMLRPEKSLSEKKINNFFERTFFTSKFWALWSTTYYHDFRSLSAFTTLDRCRYNPHEDIIGPITRFLQNEGVDFRFDSKVTNLKIKPGRDHRAVSTFEYTQDGTESIVSVSSRDVVIVSPGSVMSGSTRGSNLAPPSLNLLDAEDNLDENWSIWLGICPSLGDPYNFCTRVSESRLESFTVTIKGINFLNHFQEMTNKEAGSSALFSLRHSNWFLSLYIPRQPFFTRQSNDVQVLWGFGLFPEQEGNFSKKPMVRCSGREIMIELLQHLNVPLQPILDSSVVIPRLMPRLTAPLLSRAGGDRPAVISEKIHNLAVVGQFVELQNETSATMDYSVRGAQSAVHRMMSL